MIYLFSSLSLDQSKRFALARTCVIVRSSRYMRERIHNRSTTVQTVLRLLGSKKSRHQKLRASLEFVKEWCWCALLADRFSIPSSIAFDGIPFISLLLTSATRRRPSSRFLDLFSHPCIPSLSLSLCLLGCSCLFKQNLSLEPSLPCTSLSPLVSFHRVPSYPCPAFFLSLSLSLSPCSERASVG